jgi:hypothetical protein
MGGGITKRLARIGENGKCFANARASVAKRNNMGGRLKSFVLLVVGAGWVGQVHRLTPRSSGVVISISTCGALFTSAESIRSLALLGRILQRPGPPRQAFCFCHSAPGAQACKLPTKEIHLSAGVTARWQTTARAASRITGTVAVAPQVGKPLSSFSAICTSTTPTKARRGGSWATRWCC